MLEDKPEAWATSEVDDLVFRRARTPNAEQRDQYLELLASGVGHYAASKMVGSTGSAFKSIRGREPRFGELAAAAEAHEPEAFQDTLRGHLREVALGHLLDGSKEEHPKAFEALKMLAETHLPELEYKRRKSVTHGQDAPFEVLVGAKVTPEWLASLSDEQLSALERAQEIVESGKGLRAIEGGAA